MLQDSNTERVIENHTDHLQKQSNVSNLIERLEKLKSYYIEAEVDDYGEDGELIVTEMEQGDWILKQELYKLIDEFKNTL